MQRPNILILYTDQQRWDALGVNGNADIQTPRLDQLAGQGVNLDRFFVQNPVCMPSRVSVLTGQYPSTLGIYSNGTPVPEAWPTLPKLLHNYGYHSANIGKLHFLNHANRDHREPHPSYGFDHLEISDEPGCYEDAFRAWVRRVVPDQLDHISYGLPPEAVAWQKAVHVRDGIKHPEVRQTRGCRASSCRDDVTHTAFVGTRTIDFLQSMRQAAHPWLCIAGFYNPHSPWVAPRKFLDLYDPAKLRLPTFPPEIDALRKAGHFDDAELRSVMHGYYAMVSEVDHHVGRILDALDQTGQADNTIVIFTSDHGEWLGEHLRYGKGYPAHDPVGRVPCIIRWPAGIASPGRVCTDFVEAVDILPTLLEAAAIPVAGHLQGQSILRTLTDGQPTGRDSALIQFGNACALRTDRYHYVAHADGREFLYDVAAPLGSYHDLARDPRHAADLNDQRRKLLARLLAAEHELPRQWAY
ncbi:MAG: sulfatase-like hydrolase/transferase [Phycisphaeraceae bacterium]|nr:sulfatase-like hydrolase/transferase [Phycisphaeraceae bacterium]